ncbi:hypothetical protein DPMN_043917 [Dreissena polymorpha]|uniref:Uncharacterized protein n=1 Tax=Dreissena polymorpha TaxID=45954 RepID=A0A9D4HY99_DREPO|nr:hypothetical protein DPMN_043917 [Dreissena polymorpha]
MYAVSQSSNDPKWSLEAIEWYVIAMGSYSWPCANESPCRYRQLDGRSRLRVLIDMGNRLGVHH